VEQSRKQIETNKRKNGSQSPHYFFVYQEHIFLIEKGSDLKFNLSPSLLRKVSSSLGNQREVTIKYEVIPRIP